MSTQLEETGWQGGAKSCSNCNWRGGSGWSMAVGGCKTCTGYSGGYSNWKADTKTLAGYLEAVYKDECHLGDTKLKVTPVPQSEYDIVSKPKHYMLFEDEGIEVRDVIEKLVEKLYRHTGSVFQDKDHPLFESDYVQMMQYLMRFMDKNGLQDLEKARWYLDKLIESYGEQK